ncbi:MAG: NYN domain-containing protein, partial [Bacteroidetes bacterium]
MEGPNVALYLDFENLAISAETVYPSREKPLNLEPIIDFAASKGVICTRKAYADWSKHIFSQYQNRLMDQGFELIHLPETNQQGKNGSDVRLAVDVMEYLEFYQGVQTFIIGSGDTDFIPLIQRLRARGKTVITLGFEHSVGNLVKRNSTEFKSLEDLIGKPEAESPSSDLTEEPDASYGRRLMLRVQRAHNNEDEPLYMSQLKQQLLRIDPSFSEKELGFSSFKQFVLSLKGDVVARVETRDETLPMVYLQDPGEEESPQVRPSALREEAFQFLVRRLRYSHDPHRRQEMAEALVACFAQADLRSMNEMFEQVSTHLDRRIPKSDIKKYINTLFTGGAFESSPEYPNGPLLSRPFALGANLNRAEALDQVYIRR